MTDAATFLLERNPCYVAAGCSLNLRMAKPQHWFVTSTLLSNNHLDFTCLSDPFDPAKNKARRDRPDGGLEDLIAMIRHLCSLEANKSELSR